ncbi:RNA polymerase sigma factor (sigma-70 family) [Humibacillus xanthopallidus]|uniref:RNA polymerase sigma factor (Sigma-70 family) n=1 Tax=Humibacillus xanthopallidus TaxID=412689 RepID=A0A543PNH6_9MICO|nr:RNA polymerase sigma factor (sigma-70 family) [Humibacillus xanthopallidus]
MESGEQLWRSLAPQVLGALVRRYGDFDRAEDAVQEALLAASTQWPRDGMPHDPRAWLVRVASRRLIDHWRADDARARRERADAGAVPTDALVESPADSWVEAGDAGAGDAHADDTLTLLLLCCHPALTPPSQVALTLRAVGGLTTAEIASAFLVPESTMAQRISRAKQGIRAEGAQFLMPEGDELRQRMAAVLHVLYLVFNEGYTTSHGSQLQRVDLTREAIRLTRAARELLPDDGEVAGLLALMLLTEARRPARTAADGSLVPLAEQDRSLWLSDPIDEGVGLLTWSLAATPVGPYQLQAAIAAVHDEAATVESTDWEQVLTLYEMLERTAPGPMVTLGRAVAVAMARGPQEGLALVDDLERSGSLVRSHRLHSVRAHLLEQVGDREAARESYLVAAGLTTSLPEREYLQRKAARV